MVVSRCRRGQCQVWARVMSNIDRIMPGVCGGSARCRRWLFQGVGGGCVKE